MPVERAALDRDALKRHCEEQGLTLPVAFIDDANFEHNRRILFDAFAAMPNMKMRIASKSLRCGPLIRRLLDGDPRGETISGIMALRVDEARHLVDRYGIEDVLVAYPVASPVEVRAVAELVGTVMRNRKLDSRATASIVVDSYEQIQMLGPAACAAGVEIPVVLELDLAFRPFGCRWPTIGVRRSPLSNARSVCDVAELVRATEGVRLHGLMSYEAHHAAVPDRPHERAFKRLSAPAMARLRSEVDTALRQAGFTELPLLNGGGSGSYPQTSRSPYVNEVAIGSAFYKTALFDRHAALAKFKPSLYYAIQVVRIPKPGWITCFGGGYYASGGGEGPVVATPTAVRPTGTEEFGETQTPLRVAKGTDIGIGDLVICRPAKAGEPLERFASLHLLRDDALVESMPTYRGDDQCFG